MGEHLDVGAEGLPASVRMAWWGTSWLRGHLPGDGLAAAVRGPDAVHLVALEATPGSTVEPLVTALGALRSRGADAVGAALPVEGDLVGLGGPASFNSAALEAGEAVIVVDAAGFVLTGLVPARVGAVVTWCSRPAQRRQVPDVGEANRALRGALLEAEDALARLDIARWRPEAVDLLMNAHLRRGLPAPDGVPARCVVLATRALEALEVVALALEDDGGAVTAHEAGRRRDALLPLGRAARRALVAAASPEVWPPG